MTDATSSPWKNEDTIPVEKIAKLLELLSPKSLEKLATKLFGFEPTAALPVMKEDHKRVLTGNIIKHISTKEIIETPKRKGVKDALFGQGEFKIQRYDHWHIHYTTKNADTIMRKIINRIKEFVEDPDVEGFHVGKCTADNAKEGVYNRWNTTYSRGYSGMIVVYEDTEVNPTFAASRWEAREKRQLTFEKELHRTFNNHKKWIPQSTDKPGSLAESPKKTLCLYLAYYSKSLGVIDWNSEQPPQSPNNTNRHQAPVIFKPLPSTPTKFTSEPIVVPATRVTNISHSHATPVNKELTYNTPEKNRSVAGPRGLVGYEGTIADLKDKFDKDDIKRCKLKLLTGESSGKTIEITRFNGSSTYIQTASGDNRTCSTSNRVKVLSYG